MKKTILFTLLTLFMLNVFAQSENENLKIEVVGYVTNSRPIIKVTNKQGCLSNVKVHYDNIELVKMIRGHQSDTFLITTPSNCKVTAKTDTVCNCGSSNGYVETMACSVTPVIFEYVKVSRIESNYYNIEFKISETDGSDHFNIQVSTDGKNFKTINVVTKDSTKINQIYNLKIKL